MLIGEKEVKKPNWSDNNENGNEKALGGPIRQNNGSFFFFFFFLFLPSFGFWYWMIEVPLVWTGKWSTELAKLEILNSNRFEVFRTCLLGIPIEVEFQTH